MDTILPSQPSSYSQIIKSSLRLYQASFSHIILLSLALSIAAFIPRLLSVFIGYNLFVNLPAFSLHRLWALAINLACLTFFIGIIWRMNCIIRNVHEPLIEDLSVGLRKLFYVFLASIIQCAIVFAVFLTIVELQVFLFQYHLLFNKEFIGLLFTFLIFFGQLLLIGYVSTLFIFFIPLIAIENKGILGSLKRSVQLVWNHWWRVFTVQITPWLTYAVLLILIRFTLHINIHIYFLQPGGLTLWPTLLHIVIFAIYIPWVAATLLVQLKDIELRKKIIT